MIQIKARCSGEQINQLLLLKLEQASIRLSIETPPAPSLTKYIPKTSENKIPNQALNCCKNVEPLNPRPMLKLQPGLRN